MKNKYVVLAIAILLGVTAFFTAHVVTSMLTGDDSPPAYEVAEYENDTPDIDFDIALTTLTDGSLTLSFSETEAFHTSDITIAITASNPDAMIFYTLDGTVPTARSLVYSDPLPFHLLGRVNSVTLRAIAVYNDYASPPLTKTYFLGPNIDDRFETMVFSLTTNPDYLFDHYIGIFVEGALREEFLHDNPGHYYIPPDPANFNMRGMEAERPTHMEIISPEGERLFAQDIGIRTHGGWSRAHSQKSIRLVPRRIYTPHAGQFHFDFFPDETAHDGAPITRYNQLILRNAGNDRDHGMIRNELGSVLLRNAGFMAVTPVRPAVVFINGQYYGFAWLNVRFTPQYMQALYNSPTRYFDIVGMGERWIDSDDPRIIADIEHKNSFAYEDLSNDIIFDELQALVDIDNLLFYYAFQIFVGQEDWPQNNLRRWRYTGTQADGLAPELDGRWRFIAFDLDWTFGLYGYDYTLPTFQNVIEADLTQRWTDSTDARSPLLAAILQRPDMAERFTIIMNDIAANVVNEELVTTAVNDLLATSRNEIAHAIHAQTFQHWFSMRTLDYNTGNMIHFARYRYRHIFDDLMRLFEFEDEMFNVYVTGGEAIIGSVRATSARYFAHLEVPVQPIIPPGTEFDHWLINGARTDQPNITITAEDGETVILELVTR